MKVVVGEVIVAMPIARMPSTGSAVPGTGAAMPLAASKARSTHRPSKMRASACKMTGAAEMGSAAKTSTSEVRPTDEASTGEVASSTETSSPVGGISLLNRGRAQEAARLRGQLLQ
jgi:hypothetical protein